ncbi:MAG TPA: NTP transferase domain-containing protein [Acidimicrobiales bacterium]|nr:NTP transferase domain-containing protein [Acidimicrobiales bacterium]
MTACAVVLAAGGGSRFVGGGHKLLAPLGDRTVVRRAVEHAAGAGLPVVVVQGAVDLAPALTGLDVDVVANERWAEGQATSLQVGLAWARRHGHDAAVVGLGDQPGVPASAWAAVAATTAAPVAVATYDGRRRNPVRLASEVWDALPTAGDEGARSLMRRRPDLVVEVACEGEPHDIDTTEDLERWS